MIVQTIELICLTENCGRFSTKSVVPLQYVVPGVLARPNFICADCLMELALVTEEEVHG